MIKWKEVNDEHVRALWRCPECGKEIFQRGFLHSNMTSTTKRNYGVYTH